MKYFSLRWRTGLVRMKYKETKYVQTNKKEDIMSDITDFKNILHEAEEAASDKTKTSEEVKELFTKDSKIIPKVSSVTQYDPNMQPNFKSAGPASTVAYDEENELILTFYHSDKTIDASVRTLLRWEEIDGRTFAVVAPMKNNYDFSVDQDWIDEHNLQDLPVYM